MRATDRVLVVDDEAPVLRVLERALVEEGLAVETAQSFEAAVTSIEARPPSVVVSDVRLPDRDGLDLARWIRDQTPGVVVILMTGYASVEGVAEGLRLGAFDYLLKPFDDLGAVVSCVSRALERRRLDEQAGARQRRAAQEAQLSELRALVGNIAQRLRRVAPTREAHALLDELEEALTPARRAITSSLPIEERPPPGELPRVLVVDDDRYVLRAMKRLLRTRARVVTAERGVEALALLREDRAFDALLLDIAMPGLDGFEVFERLGVMDADLQRRVVFCSGACPPEKREIADRQSAFLGKPFTLAQLMAAMEAVVVAHGKRSGQAISN